MWPGVMTRLMACPPTCGAAAAIVCSDEFAKAHGLDRSVRIKAQAMTTDRPVAFEARDMREVVGFGMAQAAANQVYEAAGIGPDDLDVVELHDCFAHNELLSYEALGLCPVGGAEKFVCRRRQHLRRQGGHQPVGRPAEQGPSARRHRASPSAPSWSSSCAAAPASARSKARGSRCSTTSVSAAPAS